MNRHESASYPFNLYKRICAWFTIEPPISELEIEVTGYPSAADFFTAPSIVGFDFQDGDFVLGDIIWGKMQAVDSKVVIITGEKDGRSVIESVKPLKAGKR